MSSTALYLVGFLILTLGVALGAHLIGLSAQWIAVIVILFLGLGILKAVSKTRSPEPPAEE